MKPKTGEAVRWYAEGKASVRIVPSQEEGVFVTKSEHEYRVGKEVTLLGMTPEDARMLEVGDETVLGRYLQADPATPGVYQMVDCFGSLKASESSSYGISDNVVREFVPLTPVYENPQEVGGW